MNQRKRNAEGDRARVHPWEGWLFALAASALWGLAPILTKGALQGFSPEVLAVGRLCIGSALCHLLAGTGSPWLVRDPWLTTAGIALGVDFVLYNYGLQHTSAALAGLLVNVEALTTMILAVWILGEKLDRRRGFGCFLTMVGAVYLSLDGSPLDGALADRFLFGNLLVMASAMCWSVYAVAQRRSRTEHNLFARLATIFLVAAMTTSPFCLREDAWNFHPDFRAWMMFGGLTVLCTFAVYWIYARAQQTSDVSILAALLCSTPVFSIFFAAAILGESLTRELLTGGLIVMSGIVVLATHRDAANDP